MADFTLKFKDNSNPTFTISAEKFKGINEIEIIIEHDNNYQSSIYLNKSAAIKFAKTLRTEINKITESEVGNG